MNRTMILPAACAATVWAVVAPAPGERGVKRPATRAHVQAATRPRTPSKASAAETLAFPVPAKWYRPGSYRGRTFFCHRDHLGEDILLADGTAIRAIGDGRIVWYAAARGYGELAVAIEHDLGRARTFVNAYGRKVTTRHILSIYGHLRRSRTRDGAKLPWRRGDAVRKGQVIGYVNDSRHNGEGTEHLHLGIRLCGAAKARRDDPAAWFRGHERKTSFGRQYASAYRVIRQLAARPRGPASRPATSDAGLGPPKADTGGIPRRPRDVSPLFSHRR